MLVYPGQMQGGVGGQMPGAVPVPGPSVYPPQFSYGLQPGYGQQNGPTSIGAAAMGNIPMAMSTIGMGAGVASIFSASPVLRGLSFLDPVTGGFEMGAARFGAARAGGMGMGSALGAGAMTGLPVMAAGMAAYEGMRYTGQQFMTGAREQQQLGAQLSGIGFANSGAMGGRGFGFGQQQQIGKMMREVDAADPFTTMRDLNGMMDQFTGMGMHRGLEDAKEFGKKFTEFAKTAKEMAKILGKTQQEAGEIFGQMKHAGFYTAGDVMGNTRSMSMMRGMGVDEEMFHGMQMQGAGNSRAMGMRGRAGALTSTRFTKDLLMGAQSRESGGLGLFKDADLMDITGAHTGAEAAAAMGGDLASTMGRFLTSTASGRAFSASLGEKQDGRYTGGVDRGMLAKMAGGGVRLDQLSGIGGDKLGDARGKASFVNKQDKIASSILESDQGVNAMLSTIEQEATRHFKGQVSGDDAILLFYEKQMGGDRRVMEKLLESRKHQLEGRIAALRKMRQDTASGALQLDLAQNYTISGLMMQLTQGISDSFSPVRQAGADFTSWGQRAGQGAMDVVTGTERSNISDGSRRSSLLRMSRGEATGLGGVTQTGVGDFTENSATHSIALRGSLTGSRDSIERARRLKEQLASGAPLTVSQLELGGGEGQLDRFMASDAGQRASAAVIRAKQARATGDSDLADEELEKARALMERGGVVGTDSVSRAHLRKVGTNDQYLAAMMIKSGDASGAARVAGKGSIRSHAYGDIKSARQTAEGALRDVGIKGDLAAQLAGGGVGSELFSKTASTTGGRAHDYLHHLASSPRLKDQLSGLEGDAYASKLAEIASKELGGSFSAADVQAVMKAEEQTRAFGNMAFHHVTDADGNKGAAGSGVRADLSRGYGIAAGRVRNSLDVAVSERESGAVRTGLGSLKGDLKDALGPEIAAAVASLQATGTGTSAERAAAGKRSFEDLDRLLARAGEKGVGSMVGGQELAMLSERRQKGMDAVAGGISAVASAYGVSEQQIRDAAGVKSGALSNDQLQAAVKTMSGLEAFDAFGSGAGGGITRRGDTVEGQMMTNLQTLTSAVQSTSDSVALLHAKIKGDPASSEPNASDAAPPSKWFWE